MASAEEATSWRLVFSDSEENSKSPPVAQFHTTQTSSAAKGYPADRDALALPAMPSTNLWVNERGKIILEALGDAADTVESEESDGQIGILLKHKKTGTIIHRMLRVGDSGTADFADFNSTDDIVLNTSYYVRLGAYTVPDGYMATLDAGQPVYLYLGDDTA